MNRRAASVPAHNKKGNEVGVIRDVTLTNEESLATSACGNAGITADALKALDANGTPVPGTCAGADGVSEGAPGQNKRATSASTSSHTSTAR